MLRIKIEFTGFPEIHGFQQGEQVNFYKVQGIDILHAKRRLSRYKQGNLQELETILPLQSVDKKKGYTKA